MFFHGRRWRVDDEREELVRLGYEELSNALRRSMNSLPLNKGRRRKCYRLLYII